MTESSLPGHFTVGDFRIGRVLSRTASIFAHNVLAYLAVTAVAALPPLLVSVLVPALPARIANPFQNVGAGALTFFLTIVLEILGQAIVLYGAFQNMRGKPVRLADCIKVGLRRFFPLLRLAIWLALAMVADLLFLGLAVTRLEIQSPRLVTLAVLAWFIPLVILYLIWFVATSACVVERVGVFRSLRRSRELTKGQRLRIFGLIIVVLIPALIVAPVITGVMARLGIGVNLQIGIFLTQVADLIWTAIWTAFYAILVAVAYHDLRVAKEGVDTEQIAAVFE